MSTKNILFLLLVLAGLLLRVPLSWGFSMNAPAAGTAVQTGSIITAQVDPGNTSPLAEVLFFAYGADGRLFGNGISVLPPYTWTFTLPNDYVGSVTIHAAGHVLGQATGTAPETTVTIIAALPALVSLIDITVGQDQKLFVMRSGTTDRLYVYGSYSDGITRDISGSEYGTTYTSNSETVATVDADGTINAIEAGRTIVMIKNHEKKIQATVVVR